MRVQARHNGGWRRWRNAAAACLGAAFLLFSSTAQAASLDKIEVASSLGQPLYAEVPLILEGNELVSKVFIEIASADDYKIFEVYRDPVLNSIRADVASDERGARVKLTSRTGMKTPFFNLVLKVRYGRVSHFKKYSVFLDAAKSIQRIVAKEPLPHVDVAKIAAAAVDADNETATPLARTKLTESSGNALITRQTEEHAKLQAKQQAEAEQSVVEKSDSWARVDKYGPIVRGDSLSIVANRLRTDARYSSNQVMVALFEKNRDSFDKENMNLIKAGSYLLTPSEQEVEQRGRSEAFRVVANHESAWKEQPRYPLEAEVQRSRYSNRVRFGEQADGKSTALVEKPVEATQDLLKAEQNITPVAQPSIVEPAVVEAAVVAVAEDLISPQIEKLMQVQSETNQLLMALQEKNEELQQQLMSNKESVDGLREKVDEGAAAASNARVEKLEILLTRLQAQLDRQAVEPTANAQATSGSEWITWILLSLVIVMLGGIAVRMRKEPVHPASDQLLSEQETEPVIAEESKAESLDEVVEEAVDSIETDEEKGSIKTDAMASFSDELSDTDTAELEAFDADAKQNVDPNVDYLSEADVYIRYGMDDEALQQLELALRVNPANADAHVKKAELLHDKQDQIGFAAAVTAATAVLAAVELKQYQAALESFAGVVEMPVSSPVTSEPVAEPLVETTEIEPAQNIAIDDAEIEELDFDLAGVEVAGVENPQADAAVLDASEEPADELNWLSDPSFGDDEAVQDDAAPSMGFQADRDLTEEEPAALSFEVDDALKINASETGDVGDLAEKSGAMELAGDDLTFEPLTVADDLPSINAEDTTDLPASFDAGATQELGSLLSEFSEEEGAVEEFGNLLSEFNEPASVEDHSPAASSEDDAIEEFGNLLSEFNEPVSVEIEPSLSDAKPATEAVETLDLGGTQELGNLLSEFTEAGDSEDDLLVMDAAASTDATEAFGNLLSEFSGQDETETSAALAAASTDATEEFGNLLSEFSGQDETETSSASAAASTDATEEFGNLLSEFSGQDETETSIAPAAASTDATEEFGNLLSEFSGSDETETSIAPAAASTDATEEFGNLLSEFSGQDETETSAAPTAASTDTTEAFAGLDGAELITDVSEPFEPGATQHLDALLGEFSDDEDEDLIFGSVDDDFDVTMIDAAKAEPVSSMDSLGLDLDHGATQELDSLLAEFSDEEGGLGLSFIDSSEIPSSDQPVISGTDLDHGATQELDSLLSEFSDAGDSESSQSDFDHGATQVLGNLLDEFNFDDDEDDKKS